MADDPLDLPQGTLDLLLLKTLALGPLHGWAIAERLQQISRDAVQVQQGSLYPALHRMERRGWIAARWGTSENNRRAKYYELTRAGRRELEVETESWRRLAAAVAHVLDMAWGGGAPVGGSAGSPAFPFSPPRRRIGARRGAALPSRAAGGGLR